MESFSLLLRLLLAFIFCQMLLLADEQTADTNSSVVDPSDLIKIEDTSGLTEDEVRQVAKKIDKKQAAKKVTKKVRWEDLSPTPLSKDWVKTKSGEWFRGKIKGLYNDKLEFDSDEVGLYTFKFDDIVVIKSYQIISVNSQS